MKIAILTWCLSLGYALSFSEISFSKPGGFYLDSLPRGKEVTLPRPAISFVSMADRVTLTATDMPQTVKLSAVNLNDGKPASFSVAIYDNQSERVKKVKLTPGAPFLYSFKGIGSISIVPEAPKGKSVPSLGMRLESDKPLSLAR